MSSVKIRKNEVFDIPRGVLTRAQVGHGSLPLGGGSIGQTVLKDSNGNRSTEPGLHDLDFVTQGTPRNQPDADSGQTRQTTELQKAHSPNPKRQAGARSTQSEASIQSQPIRSDLLVGD